MTNNIPEIVTAAQSAGFNLSAGQVTLILGAGGAAIRYLRFETALAVKTWTEVGGLTGFRKWFMTGGKSAETK